MAELHQPSTCTNVGADSPTYTVGTGDVGNTLIVTVTANNGAGSSSPVTSGPTFVVPPLPPVNNGAPSISPSNPAVGQTLTANPGSWSNSPTSYDYQWSSCSTPSTCTNVGTNSSTYTAASSDAGHTLVVAVTAINGGGSSSPVTSSPTTAVLGPPANTGQPPSISGTAAVGQTLTASPGTWSNSPSYGYQWQRCYQKSPCTNVNNTTATYPVGQADVNATLQVVVTATNAAGSASATSAATTLVPNLPGYPTASFTKSILTPVPATGSPVTFTSTSSAYGTATITSSAWNFGDGTSGAGPSVAHTYTSPGTYPVTLTVTQSPGGQTAQYQFPVTVDGSPTSAFTWNPGTPSAGASVAFQSAASAGTGGIASYSWSFGDGGTSTAANPTHTYSAAGTYTATLSVIQFDGLTASVQHSITVTGQSLSPAQSGPSATTAAIKRWLARVVASSRLPRIGALLRKNGVISKLSAPHSSGHLAITWYATVRHHKIVVARGSAGLRAGFSARIAVRLTAAGRALLTKSRTVTITISDSLRSGGVKKTDVRTLKAKR